MAIQLKHCRYDITCHPLNRIQMWMVVMVVLCYFAIHNIAVVCEIVTRKGIHNLSRPNTGNM